MAIVSLLPNSIMALQMKPNASTPVSLTPPFGYSPRHPSFKPPSSILIDKDVARQYSVSYGATNYTYNNNNNNYVPVVRYGWFRGSNGRYNHDRRDVTVRSSNLGYSTKKCLDMLRGRDGKLPQKIRNIDPVLIERISNEIMDTNCNVRWDDIVGLHHAKECVKEMVIWPLLRPDLFEGCRYPGRGLLFFGPPGTGKTMMAKAIASQAKATFFYITASSLYGEWLGESEKLVKALFEVARCRQPAVIFVDEIDSILYKHMSAGDEHDTSRRIKTEFYIGMEGFDSGNEQVLVVGATNRPQDLDEAARRRLTKRFYIPLPCSEARALIVRNLLAIDGLFKLSTEDLDSICESTEGYSGSDMRNLVKDASMGPVREAFSQGTKIEELNMEDIRPVTLLDFEKAMQHVRSSVSPDELDIYEDWNDQFGSLSPMSN